MSGQGSGERLKPDWQILMALEKVRTGANAHDVNTFIGMYHAACECNEPDLAAKWESAFNAFLSGRITPIRKAVAEVRYDGKPRIYSNKNWWNEGV